MNLVFLVRVVDGNYRIYLEIDELSYYVGTYGKRYNKVYKLELILDIHFNTNNEDLTYTIEDVQTTYKNYGIYLNQKDIQLSYDSDGDLDVLYNYVDNKVILLTINYFFYFACVEENITELETALFKDLQ